ncbi:iron chelate uptake ABC transporter family permease subunit [Paenibacillus sp. LMG 31456]|uniref:Iron chelate uptake ABC transporter family permease subunit n=1 Tax=Paenibacillus foliorum TaxID=2654974 RepID=A0A972K0C8_9BACL|nr:iron ABC transporter permease [Paenibacillus foliorum]NOU93700.1 iron chelate uptake ABC transporter family permease subunit [Paenibacillus foliorum]
MNHPAHVRGKRAVKVGGILLLICFSVIIISLNTGTIRIPPTEVLQTLFGYGSTDNTIVLFDYRLPRIVITMLAGIGLGVSGAILQGLSRNALADPGILGIHAGASFGLIVFVTYFQSMTGSAALLIPMFTFAGGVVTACLIVWLANDRHKGLLPVRLILIGIAVAAGFSAITLFLSLRLDEKTYAFTSRWLVGNVWGRDWVHVYALFPWIAIFVPYAFFQSKALNAFTLGDELAIGIGTSVRRRRLQLLAAAVALSCASVSMAGGVGFIGLVAPHLARRLVGPMHQHFLPISGLIGLVILVVADTIGRSIFQPNAIPAGIVVAAVGAPYFLYLLRKTK